MTLAANTIAGAPPVLDIDPYALDVLKDPYAFHAALRDAGPVVLLKPHGVYAVGRHAEAGVVLSDHTRFLASGGIGLQDIRKPGLFRIPSRLLETDPPEHTDVRAALTRILTPIVIRRWREHFETEAALLAERLFEQGSFDGVEEAAEAYVLKVFPAAVGVRLPRRETLAIGDMRFNQSGPPNELYHRAMERAQPYLAWFEESCQEHSMIPGSIGELLFAAEKAGQFAPGVASNIVRSFVGGGTDSTISGLGFTLNQLARNPAQFQILKSDPSRIRAAFDEAIRFESPFQVTYRTTREDTELSGYALAGDTKIGVFLGAANRDPRKWPNAEAFDVTRDTAGIHLAFGTGAHICIGQMIARLEAESLLKALVTGARALEPAGEPRYRPINQMRTLDYLPLRVTRA